MAQTEVRIADARAAASAFVALSKFTGSAKVPADLSEFTMRLQRVSGRARPLATALGRYVESKGLEGLRAALDVSGCSAGSPAEPARSDSDAAALASHIEFTELDRDAMTFAASGLY